ncbi:MAG: ComEC/Rec2 family competence protein [Rickettsiales bacterium]|nr:ComEC/Rec2 family competence protein [Rickettsiales bacterium]
MAANSIDIFLILERIKKYISVNFLKDVHNFPLWFIVAFIFGILYYSALSSEPSVIVLVMLTVSIAGVSYFFVRVRVYLLFFFFFFFGMSVIAFKASIIHLPEVPEAINNVETLAVIDQIYPIEKGRRVILRDVKLIGLAQFNSEAKIQINIRSKKDLVIGDRVKFVASIHSTKESFLPSGYDFAKHSFFNRIAATGYATSQIFVIGKDRLSAQNYIDRLRHYIFLQIKQSMPDKTANIAAALMIGDQTGIDRAVMDHMRKSGLSHVLSVSGMHLSLLSIICFFVIRYGLSCFAGFCQRYNTKKIAAYFALAATLFYLLISGAYIAAVRAFIMVALVTIAVILDREADAKRSVCLAAFIILLFAPESVFNPSFQLSFVAVLALVSAYELYLLLDNGKEKQRSVFSKVKIYLIATAFSSFIAGSATAIFVIYNFNNYSNYSLLANVLVAPVVSIIIMPMVVLSFILLPLKLHFVSLFFLDFGIKVMLKIAEFISDLPLSSFVISRPDSYVMIIFILGFFWLCFWQEKWRVWGSFLVVVSFFITIVTDHNPDIIIDKRNNIILVKSADSLIKIGKKRLSQNYQKQLFLISDTSKIQNDKNNKIHYDFGVGNKNVSIDFYSQPIFDIYHQIKSIDVTNKNSEYSINLSEINNKGSCFLYLLSNKYKSECVLDKKLVRPWN